MHADYFLRDLTNILYIPLELEIIQSENALR